MAYGKRPRQQAEEAAFSLFDSSDMARIMLLFSGAHGGGGGAAAAASPPERMFECKTCNRQFPSFQALGGHRASHKKPRLADGDPAAEAPAKPKVHGCSICGLEFAVGQALGGHMRRHRAVMADGLGLGLSLGLGIGVVGQSDDDGGKKKAAAAAAAELVFDLNAPAIEEEPDRARPAGLAVEFPVVVDFPC
ncbi:zinc finger protein ZAT7-like [Oryza glaberrima]|uniref:C2H2-type domain-containing protein n=1 Tax=Oryza glaberrima TaxID=4538 RepID=I1PA26_ORYGL|nr:zinc finger protein ZAT7-like [Oryza glaberrima]